MPRYVILDDQQGLIMADTEQWRLFIDARDTLDRLPGEELAPFLRRMRDEGFSVEIVTGGGSIFARHVFEDAQLPDDLVPPIHTDVDKEKPESWRALCDGNPGRVILIEDDSWNALQAAEAGIKAIVFSSFLRAKQPEMFVYNCKHIGTPDSIYHGDTSFLGDLVCTIRSGALPPLTAENSVTKMRLQELKHLDKGGTAAEWAMLCGMDVGPR